MLLLSGDWHCFFKRFQSAIFCKQKKRHLNTVPHVFTLFLDCSAAACQSRAEQPQSAFKLLEIDDKYKIMKPGDVVIDCGAAPGSWTQIAATRTNASGAKSHLPKGTVVSVDVLQFHPVAGAITLGGMDFTLPTAQEKIRSILAGKQINCVLSDMAPNATGVRLLDQENITRFCYSVLKFAVSMAAANSNLVVKVWDNAEVPKLEADMLRFYDNVKRIKPRSSRSNSSEFFLLGRGFKGTEKTGN
ncbi:unnamed protein product [Hermetia illucens]|uniref:rRNA methyltransferase 2, mitochondrial n=1 Tax=Hermetia illucens TaxID=343691 RepID=A0A7R8V5Y3_HERIL|nr:unnamed protein product [Hermetia illucens]